MYEIIGGDLVRGLGRRGRRISAEKIFFCRPLQNVKFGGGRRGTHCIREFQYLTHGFCVCIYIYRGFSGF